MPADTVGTVRADLSRLGDKIAWSIAAALMLFGILFYWMFVRMPDKRAEEIKDERDRTGLEISKQIAPLTLQIASLTATLELRVPDPAKEVGPAIRKRSTEGGGDAELRLDLETAKQLAEKAREQIIVGDRSDVSAAGQSALRISFQGQAPAAAVAWDTTLELIRYISFLNQHSFSAVEAVNAQAAAAGLKTPVIGVVLLEKPGVAPNGERFVASSKLTLDGVTTFMPGPGEHLNVVPDSLSSRILGIGIQMGSGWPGFMVEENIRVVLDGLTCRNVIFRHCSIAYHGGPFRLENSQFNNCSFEIPRTRPGQNLALALLGPVSVKAEAN
jgi:hypothetical protein